MTAEVAVMNKSAIALAADSAITIRNTIDPSKPPKIYNQAIKLFRLSIYQPIGLMIYGNAEVHGYPWELIIKLYRSQLKETEFDFIDGYADSFIKFISAFDFSGFDFQKYPETEMLNFYSFILNNINQKVEELSQERGFTHSLIHEIFIEEINRTYKEWNSEKWFGEYNESTLNEFITENESVIIGAYNRVFIRFFVNFSEYKLKVPDEIFVYLNKLAGLIFQKDNFYEYNSGFVIAGFGGKEIFPVLINIFYSGIYNNVFKYKKYITKINTQDNAYIIPFAQKDMVCTFLEGVDPKIKQTIYIYIERLSKNLLDYINQKNPANQQSNDIDLWISGLVGLFQEDLEKKINQFITNPILKSVRSLSKEELAVMAESLIEMTSYKRKVSMDVLETVGGPIDVAVISKGDGFIWIKRKHYFNKDYNFLFFKNYF